MVYTIEEWNKIIQDKIDKNRKEKGVMSDKVYVSELDTISDSKVVARCSICNKVMEAKGSELNSIKIHHDAGCLYCDECFKNLFKHKHNQKLYREPF